MGLIARLDQLPGNAHALAIASNASLQHAVNMQLSRDLSNGFMWNPLIALLALASVGWGVLALAKPLLSC